MEELGEYDVPVIKYIYCSGISSDNSDSSWGSNYPLKPMPHSPSHISSTSLFVTGEHPMDISELYVYRKVKIYLKGKFHVPNPLDHLSMPVMYRSGQLPLVEA